MTHKYFLRSRIRFISESSEGNSSESREMGEDNNQGNSVTVQLSTAENSVPLFRGGSPKGIYRRNIGDYLRQPYLWVKYK